MQAFLRTSFTIGDHTWSAGQVQVARKGSVVPEEMEVGRNWAENSQISIAATPSKPFFEP